MNKILGRLAGVMFAVVLGGCATLSPATPEEVVSARARGYWNAVIAGDWEKAYTFTTPGYRAAVDLFGYRKVHDSFVKHKGVEVLSASCEEPDACKVKTRLRVNIAIDRPDEITTVIEERWLREAGQWYRFIKQ